MTARRSALGRGLGALIPNREADPADAPVGGVPAQDPSRSALPGAGAEGDPTGSGPREIPVDQVDPNPEQPRRVFDSDQLESLAASIVEHGVLQPVVVRPAGDRFELIVGERRWRASRAAGRKTIPAVVTDLDPQARLEVAIVENIQRHDLNPMELAHAYQALVESGATQQEIGQKVSMDRSSIANHLRLLELSRDLQEDVEGERLTMGHAKALLQLSDPAQRQTLRDRVVKEGLSVRATERLARLLASPVERPAVPKTVPLDPDRSRVLEDLQKRFQTRIQVKGNGKKGRLELEYYSAEDLNRILSMLLGDPL
ncbi:ParB/RepB/Spo0J family partition protein [Myxococcota bacterium]|nr:ParB/RepB/Spo0J family partition protein [Myxococcota bacterium]